MANDYAQPVEAQPEYPHYRAFISYRHAEVDSAVAAAVQHGLERFWVPKSARGEDGSPHIAPVFRDKEELPVSARLGDDIEAALHGADALVVICSPRTAESAWVAREIDTFLSCHDQDRVFVVLAEGEPYDVIPERLLYEMRTATDEDGTTHEERVEKEPLACDFRGSSRSERRTELIRLAAGVLGVSFDSLVRRAQRRRTRIIASVAAIITTVACGIAAYALWSNARIAESYRQTQINESEALAVEAQELLAAGDRMEAIQVALAALPESSTSGDRPFVPSAQIALQDSVQAYPNKTFWHACYSVSDVESTCAVSKEGLLACVKTDGSVQVSDLDTGTVLSTIDIARVFGASDDPDYSRPATKLLFCPQGLVVSTWRETIALFDPQTGELVWKVEFADFTSDNIAVSHDGARIAIGWDEPEGVAVHTLDSATGAVVESYHLPFVGSEEDFTYSFKVRLDFSPDDSSLAVTYANAIWKVDLKDGKTVSAQLTANDAYEVYYLDDVIVSIGSEDWSKSLLLGTAYFDVFSADLSPLWSRSETPPTYYDSAGIFHSNFAFLVGQYDDEVAGKQLVYATGSSVRIVDQATGKETRTIEKGSPLRACVFKDGSLDTIDYEGEMTSVFMSNVTDDALLATSSVEVAEGEYATLTVVKGDPYALTYALVWDGTSSKMRVYCYRFRVDEDEEGLAKTLEGLKLDSYSTPTALGESPSPLYFINSDGTLLCAIDHRSFEPLWTVRYEDLGLGNRAGYVPTSRGVIYLFSSRPVDGSITVLKMSSENAEVLDRYVFDASEQGWSSITTVGSSMVAGEELLSVRNDHSVKYFSADTHELRLEIGPFAYSIDAYFEAHDAALVLHNESGRERFELFSLIDGSELDGQIESLLLNSGQSSAQRNVSPDLKKDSLVICCADGYLRCVDTTGWSVRWEQWLPNARIAAFSPDGSMVVVQDKSGACLLLSAATGEVLRSSSVQLPLISYFWYLGDDARTMYALATTMGLSRPETSIIKFSLDASSFGPTSVVYAAVYYSLESNQLLLCDPLFGQWGAQPMYTLDELIDQAHETVRGHELTDAERHRYRIAS
jgi:small nuclear ribonucleoprotein (snRNP)-like protein